MASPARRSRLIGPNCLPGAHTGEAAAPPVSQVAIRAADGPSVRARRCHVQRVVDWPPVREPWLKEAGPLRRTATLSAISRTSSSRWLTYTIP